MPDPLVTHKTKQTPISTLTPHPRNYRFHTDEQVEHLAQSIREHGFYKNVVVARDGTILAGHGIVLAAAALGMKTVPATHLDLDPLDPRALKLLAGDNELTRLAIDDAQALQEILQGLDDVGLLGTGYDQATLADLIFSNRGDLDGRIDPEAHWNGMPEFTQEDLESPFRVAVHFKTEEDMAAFFRTIGAEPRRRMWWPESDGHVGSDMRTAIVQEAE